MKSRNFIATALMAFAFFFGAGNLIFPPFSGMQAGTSFGMAYVGYILIDVGLSFLAIVAVAIAGRASFLTVDFPKWAGVLFWIIIYSIIGPIFAVPRTSVVTYDMGIAPLINTSSHIPVFLFSLFFFTVTCWLVLAPGKLVNFIGGYITPVLLACLLVLFSVVIFYPHADIMPPVRAYGKSAFGQGLLQGYLTMDTLGALAFGAIISGAVRSFNLESEKHVLRVTLYVSIVAGLLLSVVYFGLFYLGAISHDIAGYATNGGQILNAFVEKNFGISGQIILLVIIFLACLTTSVGLITSCSEYFHSLYRKIPYRIWAVILSIISFGIANMGLDKIIFFSIPVVIALYPLAIVVILSAIMRIFIELHHSVVIITCITAFIFSLLDAINSVSHVFDNSFLTLIPLFNQGLSWLFPSIIIFVILVFGNFCLSLLFGNRKQKAEI